jgi:hypothetical protein
MCYALLYTLFNSDFVHIYVNNFNLTTTNSKGVGYELVSKFHNTYTWSLGVECDFPI